MSEAPAAPVEFAPEQVTLGTDLFRVLTTGDVPRLEELLSASGGEGSQQAAVGQVAIQVNGTSSPSPGAGTGSLLGVTSNGNTALHLVASRGHAELAAFVCERAPSLVATRNKGLDTPLHCAARAGSREVVACILSKMRAAAGGSDEAAALRARNCLGATALHEAVRLDRAGVVDLLMAEAPELASVTTEDGVSPLYLAVQVESDEMVHLLLRPSPDGTPSPASFSGRDGETALHSAAVISEGMAQEILNWEPLGTTLLTRVDSSGKTPLQFAILYEHLDVVEMFLDDHTSSEQVHISDNHGLFPVHSAAKVGNTRIIDVLIQKCPDCCELLDDKGRNLLHCAVEHSQENVVRHVCRNGAFGMLLNAMDFEGNTPLHLAVKYGRPRIVSLLLQTMTVQTGITNKDGLTARDLADRVLECETSNYFLNPRGIVYSSLRWSRARITLYGYHTSNVDKKHIDLFKKEIESTEDEDEASNDEASNNNEDNMNKTGTIVSVLIATVAFTAAFTVPGGFIADDHPSAGTAILAKRFAFRAFVVSDTMAFASSILATCFLMYGVAREIPRNHRFWYNLLASGFVPVAAQFMIAAFAFAFHLVLGDANRGLVIFVYTVSLATVLFCFPGIWVPWHLGLAKAVWRRAGWRGLVNVHVRPSSLLHLLDRFGTSFLFMNLRRPLFVVLISASFVVAIALNIALPSY